MNRYCYLSLVDARQAAFRYLQSSIDLVENDLTKTMPDIYEEISNKLTALLPDIPGLDFDVRTDTVNPKKMRKSWTTELRHRQADLFEEILVLEKKGEEIARKIVHI